LDKTPGRKAGRFFVRKFRHPELVEGSVLPAFSGSEVALGNALVGDHFVLSFAWQCGGYRLN
jgi:hypothetical protein